MRIDDFTEFFNAIHFPNQLKAPGPFPWQRRLAEQLCVEGAWPNVLDLPTGAGKTACIDIALFHWLVCASRGEAWSAPRRIAFVVDRRIIVDEAAERARKVANAITSAHGGILAQAREILRSNTDHLDDGQIRVFTLRGGVARERNLARDPLSVSVVLSTVDQLGSRLLFRGYGIADRMRSIHAGLFGLDTLLLLDEAHIAEPFAQTLSGILREQSLCSRELKGPRPLCWARLSATPSASEKPQKHFELSGDDRAHPVLEKRLTASKPMRLIEVAKRDELPPTFAKLVMEELGLPPISKNEAARIGIVVNRIATARAAFEILRKTLKDRASVELLIGRVRPIDRDRILARLGPLLKSSTMPRSSDRPIVLVATQTIEVGADFDFHSLFIEAASYPSIKQRLGRLNRLGLRESARGAIVCVEADAANDPVYKDTIQATWRLLHANAVGEHVDLGIERAPAATRGTSPDPVRTPVLSGPLLELLVQTCPEPAVAPDAAEFLHGFSSDAADVSVVWREGLSRELTEHDAAIADSSFRVLPPLSTEAISLPYAVFRQWTASWGGGPRKIVDGGDLESEPADAELDERHAAPVLLVGSDGVELVPSNRIRPGALVVVPATRGGCDAYGWNPDSTEGVPDLSLQARDPKLSDLASASNVERRERVLVWTRDLANAWQLKGADDEKTALEETLQDPDATLDDVRAEAVAWFQTHEDHLRSDVRSTMGELLRSNARIQWLEAGDGIAGFSLREGHVRRADLIETNLQRTVRVPLDIHLRGVGRRAELYAKGVGLEPEIVAALRAAGDTHDLGKADPRFQRRLGAAHGELLAKSDLYDRSVPRGERHEAYSVAIIDRYPELIPEGNKHRALIRYLVGSHHGFGRGLHPVIDDKGISFEAQSVDGRSISFTGRPALYRLDNDWPDLFTRMNREYGPWMLAYLEAILRLADHRTSEAEIEEALRNPPREAPTP